MADSRTSDYMIAYLLDELSEQERARIEDQLEEDAVFNQILAVEDELYDAYALGTLSAERCRRFEQKFLRTPEQRRKLEFSRALLAYRPPRRRLAWLPRPALWAPVAVALALMLIAVLFYRARPPVAQPRQPVTVAFLLIPGLTRDLAGSKPLLVPPETDLVRLEALLERDLYSTYRAGIETADGAEVWSRTGLSSETTASGRAVVLPVPARFLAARDYILILKGRAPSGDFQPAAEYSFRIEKQ